MSQETLHTHLQANKRPSFILIVLLISLSLAAPNSFAAQNNIDAKSGGSQLVKPNSNTSKHDNNPRAEIWRKVREGKIGYSAVSSPEAGRLIESSGEVWRRLRNGPLLAYGAWALVLTLVALAFFYTLRGRVPLSELRSGKKLLRWSRFERILHWYTALLFLLLSFTGLSILYGRSTLIPLLGHEHFAVWASASKIIHNYSGPLFMLGLFTMIIIWFKDNLPDKHDLNWLKAYGGMIGNKHPSAGRMNAGEKGWFWLLCWAGIFISLTGLMLDFPNLGQERLFLQIIHIIHLLCALLLMIGALGHIYIGTIGTEGALEGMISGEVDESWAKQHHDEWCEQMLTETQQSDSLTESATTTDYPEGNT